MAKTRRSYEKILKKYYGYDKLKDDQFKIINSIINDEKDICAILATGFGKSICYQLPHLITKESVIVISPLLALMEDQSNELKDMGIDVCCLNSNNSDKYQDIKDILAGNNKIIFITPEFFSTKTCERFVKKLENELESLCCVAIDESHCISSWSDDSFRPEYKNLKKIREWVPEVPILTLTATANEKVQKDIIKILKLKDPYVIKGDFDRKNIKFNVGPKDGINIYSDVYDVAKKYKNQYVIVYAKKRAETEKIAKYLSNKGIKAKHYHAGLGGDVRNEVQRDFMSGTFKCMVATIAFGMGINNKHVRLVVHYGCPANMDAYYQEVGRAGRDGEESECYMFYSTGDFSLNSYLINKNKNIEYKSYALEQLKCIKSYIYSESCRRAVILKHFGQSVDYTNCGKCDNCCASAKQEKHNMSKEIKMLLGLLSSLDKTYGITMIVNILRGSKAKKVTSDMKKLSYYGKGKNYSVNWWKELIGILIKKSFIIEKSFDSRFNATVLEITDTGISQLAKKRILLSITKSMKQEIPIHKKSYEDILSEHFPFMKNS